MRIGRLLADTHQVETMFLLWPPVISTLPPERQVPPGALPETDKSVLIFLRPPYLRGPTQTTAHFAYNGVVLLKSGHINRVWYTRRRDLSRSNEMTLSRDSHRRLFPSVFSQIFPLRSRNLFSSPPGSSAPNRVWKRSMRVAVSRRKRIKIFTELRMFYRCGK